MCPSRHIFSAYSKNVILQEVTQKRSISMFFRLPLPFYITFCQLEVVYSLSCRFIFLVHNIKMCAWTGGFGVASLAQEERPEPHNELLSSLKNSSEGQPQYASIVGQSSAVLRSLPAAVDFLRNCSNHHPQLRIQVTFSIPTCFMAIKLHYEANIISNINVNFLQG
jgi:hypothetical protein